MKTRMSEIQQSNQNFNQSLRKSRINDLIEQSRINEVKKDESQTENSNLLIDAIKLGNVLLIDKHSRNTRFVSRFRLKMTIDPTFLPATSGSKFTRYCFGHLEKMGRLKDFKLLDEEARWISAILFYFLQTLHTFEEEFSELNRNVIITIKNVFVESVNSQVKALLLDTLSKFIESFSRKHQEVDNGFISSQICDQIHVHLMFCLFDTKVKLSFVTEYFASICYFYRVFLVDFGAAIYTDEVI